LCPVFAAVRRPHETAPLDQGRTSRRAPAPLWRWLPGSAAALATLDGGVDSGRLGLDLARKAGMGAGAESLGDIDPRAVTRHSLSLPVRVCVPVGLVWWNSRIAWSVCRGIPCPAHRTSEPFYRLGGRNHRNFFKYTININTYIYIITHSYKHTHISYLYDQL
jgi:hypothetical protein